MTFAFKNIHMYTCMNKFILVFKPSIESIIVKTFITKLLVRFDMKMHVLKYGIPN